VKKREVQVSDLESTELAMIHTAQSKAFKDEIGTLKTKRENGDPNSRVFVQQRKASMKRFSTLYKLDPFVD